MPTFMLPLPIILQAALPTKPDIFLQFTIVAVVVASVVILLRYVPAARAKAGAQTSAPTVGPMPSDYMRTEIRESVRDGVREAMQEIVVPALENNTAATRELGQAISSLDKTLAIVLDRTPRTFAAGAGPQKS